MIVRKMEGPAYHRRRREPLPGRGSELRSTKREEKSFEQYLLEAFEGEVVREGETFAPQVSELTRENIIRLSRY